MRNITSHLLTTNKRNPYLYRASTIYKSLYPLDHQIILTIMEGCINSHENNSFRIQVHLSPKDNYDTELAYFNIYGNYIRAPFEQLSKLKNHPYFAPPSMNINCEDYQKQGVSKMLILIAFHFAKKEYRLFNDESELFIDTDASTIVGQDAHGMGISYWTAIGMTDNEDSPSNAVSVGYEKRCMVKDLHPYLFR